MHGLLTGRETPDGFQPSTFHRIFRGRVSGNRINGLGESSFRRPTAVYHDRRTWHPWRIVQEGFYLRVALRGFWKYIREAQAIDAKTPTPLAPTPIEDTPEGWSRRIKDKAHELGADAVGIARMNPDWVFDDEEEITAPWIVVIASRMNYEVLAESTKRNFPAALTTVMEVYNTAHRTARELADWIQASGWKASGHGSPMRTSVTMIPAAIAAGIGELGKHGSMIHESLGSNFRMAYVLTHAPLAPDAPRTFGADDFCLSCRLCTRQCPPGAISDEKQIVRGVEKWYIDFDRCVPYFNDNYGCAICLAVCPWSRPGVAEKLTAKMAERRRAAATS